MSRDFRFKQPACEDKHVCRLNCKHALGLASTQEERQQGIKYGGVVGKGMPVICLRECCGKRHQLSEKLSWECLHTTKHIKAVTQCVTACVDAGGEGKLHLRVQKHRKCCKVTIMRTVFSTDPL